MTEETVEMEDSGDGSKRADAMELVGRYSTGLGAASLFTIPLVELVIVPAFHLKMIRDLAHLYGRAFSEDLVKSILATVMGAGFVVAGGRVLGSLLRGLPVIGPLSGVISATVLSGTTTYCIGKLFVEHFETGGTLLSIDADKMRAHYEELINAPKPVRKAPLEKNYVGIKP